MALSFIDSGEKENMLKIYLGVLAAALPLAANATVIDFEDRTVDETIDSQYSSVATFSSEPGFENAALSYNSGIILCTRPVGGFADCLHDTYIDFTSAVNGLEFDAIEPNAVGVDATFNIFADGGMHTEFLTGLGGTGNKHVDLSAYTNVTRLEIVDILDDPSNENGVGWDNFSFNVVPEPFSMVALAGGLVALARRRRR